MEWITIKYFVRRYICVARLAIWYLDIVGAFDILDQAILNKMKLNFYAKASCQKESHHGSSYRGPLARKYAIKTPVYRYHRPHQSTIFRLYIYPILISTNMFASIRQLRSRQSCPPTQYPTFLWGCGDATHHLCLSRQPKGWDYPPSLSLKGTND